MYCMDYITRTIRWHYFVRHKCCEELKSNTYILNMLYKQIRECWLNVYFSGKYSIRCFSKGTEGFFPSELYVGKHTVYVIFLTLNPQNKNKRDETTMCFTNVTDADLRRDSNCLISFKMLWHNVLWGFMRLHRRKTAIFIQLNVNIYCWYILQLWQKS